MFTNDFAVAIKNVIFERQIDFLDKVDCASTKTNHDRTDVRDRGSCV